MLLSGELLWIISAARIKRLIGGFSFLVGVCLIYKRAEVCVIDERKNLKSRNICECICSVLPRRVRGSSILAEANLHLAVKLQPDFTIRAIL